MRERILATGRDPASITIVAVSKGRPVAACREAVAAGLTILGENRVQEALPKLLALRGPEWHLIGHLQTNKVSQISGRFALVQSVDSIRLAELIADRDATQRVLLQVNVSRESEKHGFTAEAVVDAARRVASLLPLAGLMGIGPRTSDPGPCFAELAGLVERCREATGMPLPILSMGMSGDFEAAVREGATLLRLGTALFGEQVS